MSVRTSDGRRARAYPTTCTFMCCRAGSVTPTSRVAYPRRGCARRACAWATPSFAPSGLGNVGTVTDEPRSGDHLPEDLDVTAYAGPYVFPDIRRRRIPGVIYAVLAAISLWAGISSSNE